MAKPPIKPTSMQRGHDSSLEVTDAYDSGSLSGLNVDSGPLGGSVPSLPELPEAQMVDTTLDTGLSASEINSRIKDAKKGLPSNIELSSVLKGGGDYAKSLSAVGAIKDNLSPSQLTSMDLDDFRTLVADTSKMTDIVSGKSSPFSGSGNIAGMAVTAAAGVLSVRQAMKELDSGNILKTLKSTTIPNLLFEAGMESVLDIAAEYGLQDVAEAIFDIIKERLTPAKRKLTIRGQLSGFRFRTVPEITEISKGEQSFIRAVGDFAGLAPEQSDFATKLVVRETTKIELLSREDQAKNLVRLLKKIDKDWNRCIRNGQKIPLLDLYRYASADARTALLMVDETRTDMLLVKDRKLKPEGFSNIVPKWHPLYYI